MTPDLPPGVTDQDIDRHCDGDYHPRCEGHECPQADELTYYRRHRKRLCHSCAMGLDNLRAVEMMDDYEEALERLDAMESQGRK